MDSNLEMLLQMFDQERRRREESRMRALVAIVGLAVVVALVLFG